MYIKVVLYDKNKNKSGYSEPDIQIFKGNFAVESLILKFTEIYFGKSIKDKIESLLIIRKEEQENGFEFFT